MSGTVALLPGDGIGPEVMAEAKRVLYAVGFTDLPELPFGANALRQFGEPLPVDTLSACQQADAVLVGAVGDPEFDEADARPEEGMFALRRALGAYANLRPAKRIANGARVDLIVVRELLGGLYYGERGVREDGTVFDTCEYHPTAVERVARRAFELAQSRRRRLVSVDKANVLATSRLWRGVVSEVAADYPDVELRHLFVDAAALALVERPWEFDVILSENLFADILSEVAAGVTGGIGLAPSASLGDGQPGIFEPIHGAAPDIAGQGIANPAAMLRSVSMMLAYGFGHHELSARLDDSIQSALIARPTTDLGGDASTVQFGDVVLAEFGG